MGLHTSSAQAVPASLVKDRAAGWHAFTTFTKISCVSLAILLLLMLVFLK